MSAATMMALAQTPRAAETRPPRSATAAEAAKTAVYAEAQAREHAERQALEAELQLLIGELEASKKREDNSAPTLAARRSLESRITNLKAKLDETARRRAVGYGSALQPNVAAQKPSRSDAVTAANRNNTVRIWDIAPNVRLSPEVARERQRLMSTLDRPVDVELRDATLRQAAEALSQASGVKVEVDRSVAGEMRISMLARSTTLRTVLEQIARARQLMIAPAENGVILKPVPTLEVDGRRTTVMEMPFAPWSSDWGAAPLAARGYATFAVAPGNLTTRVVQGDAAPALHVGAVASRASSGTISVTALGSNTLVVAHPAPAGGEAGIVLSVYRLEGTQLRLVSTTHHPLGRDTAQAGKR
jgi:hypothetical protein